MKKPAAIILTLAILSFSVIASAQIDDEKRFQIGVKGGLNLWFDDPLQDDISNNWSIGGEIKYWFANNIGIGGEVQWTDAHSGVRIVGLLDAELEYTMIPINLNVYRRFPIGSGKTSYYLGAGVSIVYADASASASSGDFSLGVNVDHTAFGANAVAGAEFHMIFLEAQWLWAKPEFDLGSDMHLGGLSFWTGIRF